MGEKMPFSPTLRVTGEPCSRLLIVTKHLPCKEYIVYLRSKFLPWVLLLSMLTDIYIYIFNKDIFTQKHIQSGPVHCTVLCYSIDSNYQWLWHVG